MLISRILDVECDGIISEQLFLKIKICEQQIYSDLYYDYISFFYLTEKKRIEKTLLYILSTVFIPGCHVNAIQDDITSKTILFASHCMGAGHKQQIIMCLVVIRFMACKEFFWEKHRVLFTKTFS